MEGKSRMIEEIQIDEQVETHTRAKEVPEDGNSHGVPWDGLDPATMPGHWLLAQLGKRVLRPGGKHLTDSLLAAVNITPADLVVEFAPGLGYTTRKTLARNPLFYTAIERDTNAATRVRRFLPDVNSICRVADAADTGLPPESTTVVYGEAMLTMQPEAKKHRIVKEAFRLLYPGGRYGIHELLLTPDDISKEKKSEINSALSKSIRVGARPLTAGEWKALLVSEGFKIEAMETAPMHLLRFPRMLSDEGFVRTLRIIFNVIRKPTARSRVLDMRRTFQRYEDPLAAVMMTARKPQ